MPAHGLLNFLTLNQINEVLKEPFFQDRETKYCGKCGQYYWERKPISDSALFAPLREDQPSTIADQLRNF